MSLILWPSRPPRPFPSSPHILIELTCRPAGSAKRPVCEIAPPTRTSLLGRCSALAAGTSTRSATSAATAFLSTHCGIAESPVMAKHDSGLCVGTMRTQIRQAKEAVSFAGCQAPENTAYLRSEGLSVVALQAESPENKKAVLSRGRLFSNWLRGQDLNLRPS